MRWLRVFAARLRGLVRRDVVAGEIHDELRFHVDARVEQYEREGLTRDEATRKARHRVGNIAVHQDRGYDIRGGGFMETIWQDVRYSVRLLARQRGFTLVAILTLALGIGASTAIFSVIDAAMLRPLPYPQPEALVRVTVELTGSDGRTSRMGPSYADLERWQQAGVFSAIATWHNVIFGRIVDGDEPERITAGEMSLDYLKVFATAPMLGRGFTADDMVPGAPPVILLGYRYWQSHLGGDPQVVGRSLRFDDGPATIIGVLPARLEHGIPVWRPVQIPDPDMRGTGRETDARLLSGITADEAGQRLTAMTPALAGRDGQPLKLIVRVTSMLDEARAEYRTTVNILTGAVGLILLIACVNVAGLLLARGATRQAELAVRASIGAGRGRLIRQLLTESVVLSVAGGTVGLLVAWLTLDALVANIPLALSADAPAELNLRVMAATIGLTVLTGLIFGLAPAFRLSRVRFSTALARGGRRHGSALTKRGGQTLIGAEVALAVVLVAGAGLMIRSFARIAAVDLGFNPDAFHTMKVTPLSQDPSTHTQYYLALLRTLRQVPGISAAGAIDNVPLGGSGTFTTFVVDGKSSPSKVDQILPGYFDAIGQPLLQGAPPTDADYASGRNLMTVTDGIARKWFPDGHVIGRQVIYKVGQDEQTWEVGAVVANIRGNGPTRDTDAGVYTLFRPTAASVKRSRGLVVVVRTNGGAGQIADTLRRAAAAVGPRVLVEQVQSGGDLFSQEVLRPRQRTVLLSLLGGLGLVLALVGVFGMTAYAVARRTQEIGVRIAFGARTNQVVGTMVRDSAWPIAIGTLVGLAGAAVATKLIASFLFQTAPTDPGTFTGVAVTLILAGCLAAWIPARRAARVDPVTALRVD